ncbi:hypothetical protein ACI3LY_004336 [Candidozyma auris]|uniref:Uncharacterized protein n=2 Tax=Candidozyma auris TaxID=498019 RepID=A0A2H0ZDG3_CANAR|nr:hypothetical_protein [[Candida] auris]KNE01887.1 hypothetical protein QG37_01234 [[Candida] auris]PIS48382.1 hypothetical protein B9J08_005072 [[Candida] auris]PIS48996.1 hypothetical protein CJI97_005157 [[Candida] auris]PSK79632.1 hypothetical protein CJJ07_000496 [[Candida] auris]QEL62113.1 hypothetical protein CJJ09_004281 [[Candida] auris]
MPDLFDNFFGKMSAKMNGGKTKPFYGGSSQVNTGRFYSYHMNGTNNKSWMTDAEMEESRRNAQMQSMKPRMGSVGSMDSMESEGDKSRKNSVT